MQSECECRMSDPSNNRKTTTTTSTTAALKSAAAEKQQQRTSRDVPFAVALLSGAVAGTTVDLTLFPLDTLKTRLQSAKGFQAAGGFSNIFKGVGAAFLGSAPGAALFFTTYETCKPMVRPLLENVLYNSTKTMNNDDISRLKYTNVDTLSHMAAATLGETAACLIRVPTEVVKQRMQTLQYHSLREAVTSILRGSPNVSGFYVGFGITVFREIPFSVIQFPLWERLKIELLRRQQLRKDNNSENDETMEELGAIYGALCGSIAGGFAGAITTPLDVIKTRTMLGSDRNGVPYQGVSDVFRRTLVNDGFSAFFNGVVPRTMWITIGGFCFFGAYEFTKHQLLTVPELS